MTDFGNRGNWESDPHRRTKTKTIQSLFHLISHNLRVTQALSFFCANFNQGTSLSGCSCHEALIGEVLQSCSLELSQWLDHLCYLGLCCSRSIVYLCLFTHINYPLTKQQTHSVKLKLCRGRLCFLAGVCTVIAMTSRVFFFFWREVADLYISKSKTFCREIIENVPPHLELMKAEITSTSWPSQGSGILR